MNLRVVILFLAYCLVNIVAQDDHGDNSVSFNKESFNEAVVEKPLFVMFFAPWCGHCKRLASTWEELAKEYKGGEVTIGKVDCTVHTDLCSDHGVRGYPTVKFFNKNTDGDKFSGQRSLETFKAFITEKLSAGEKPKQEEKTSDQKPKEAVKEKAKEVNGLYDLTKETFDAHVAKGHHFVKFYAPWCGHCKRLAPTWEDLAAKTKEEGKATIAKVDCTQHTAVCTKFHVRGYPTLMWFTDGQKSEDYSGGRDIHSLAGFVKKMTSAEFQTKKTSVDGKIPDGKEDKEEEEKPEVDNGLYVLTDNTFDSHVATGNHFIKFYAPWCGHCKRLAPTWSDLAKEYDNEDSVVKIGKVDCTQNRRTCGKYSVSGYPTLLFFSNGENKGPYRGPRDIGSLREQITKVLGDSGEKKEEEEKEEEKEEEEKEEEEEEDKDDDADKNDFEMGVVELKDEDFEDTISEELTFVMFTDEACESCKKVLKILEEVVESIDDPEMMIAVMDCTENTKTCEKENVKDNFPKFRLYNNGKYVGLYTGEKTVEAMKGYISHQLKTLGGHGGEL